MARFMRDEPIVRYLPDREHDSLDLRALVRVCADWADGSRRLPDGICNLPGRRRSLHGTLAHFAAAAEQRGHSPRIEDREGPKMPWPFMSDERFRAAAKPLEERSDAEIAAACCAKFPHGFLSNR
jgi:hypothetical protein